MNDGNRRGRPVVLAAMTLLGLALAVPGRTAEAQDSLEYPVKAAFLVNLVKFAEWPRGSAQAASPTVTICILGRDPFGRMLDEIVAGRSAGGRPVEVRRYRNIEGIESCHVLFIAPSEAGKLARVFARLGESPVLTVGECGEFTEQGGVIRLLVEDNRARFEVDLRPLHAKRLRLSSKLLAVARSVRVGRED